MAKIIIDELITLIGFKTTKESKQAISSVENGIRTMKKMALVATGAMTGLGLAMAKIASGVDQQAKFAHGLGLSFENLQRLQFAGQKAGASVSDMNGFLETLTKTMTSTVPGQYNAALLQLGISARDANGEVKELVPTILEISKALSEKGPARRQQFAARLGASSTIANFLGQGTEQITRDLKELDKVAGVIPERLAKVAAALVDDSLLRTQKTLKAISTVIALSLAPSVSKLLDQFDLWLVKNQKIIAVNLGGFIKAVSRGFAEFGDTMVAVGAGLNSLTKTVFRAHAGIKSLNTVTFLTKASLLALATAILAPIAPFLAAGAAIEIFMNSLPDLVGLVNEAANLFNSIFPSSVDKTTGAINKASDSVERLLGLFSNLKGVTDFLNQVSKKAGAPLTLFNLKAAKEGLKNAVSTLKGPGTSGIQQLVSQAESTGSISVPSASRPANGSTTNNVNITVNGAGSPSQVAKEVKTQFDLSTAVQIASPGFNRGKVA